jgi:hypothetical protein
MDYVPVYEGEADEPAAANSIKISTEKVQKLGVRTEAAELRALDKQVRAAGRIEIDERRSFAISPKFEGYVERLHVNVTGQPVAKGQPLFEVYSPELVSAQREYTIAAQGVEALKDAGSEARSGMQQLAESSLLRLRNWDISEEQIRALAKSGASKRTLTFRSPVSGVVTEKSAAGHALHAGRHPVSGGRPVVGVGCRRRVRTGHRSGAYGGHGEGAHQCLPGQGLRGPRDLCLSDPQSRNADGAGSGRTGQSGPAPEARDVCPGGGAGGARDRS